MNDPLYASILHPERMKTEENNSKQSTTDHGETQNIKSDGNDNNTSQADILGEPGSKTDSSDKSQLSCSNSASDTDIVSNSVPDICKVNSTTTWYKIDKIPLLTKCKLLFVSNKQLPSHSFNVEVCQKDTIFTFFYMFNYIIVILFYLSPKNTRHSILSGHISFIRL